MYDIILTKAVEYNNPRLYKSPTNQINNDKNQAFSERL